MAFVDLLHGDDVPVQRSEEAEPRSSVSESALARHRHSASMMVPERKRQLGRHLRSRRVDPEVEALSALIPTIRECHDERTWRADQRFRPGRDTIIFPPLAHRQSSAS